MSYIFTDIDNARAALVAAATQAEDRADLYQDCELRGASLQAQFDANALWFAAFAYMGIEGDHWSRRRR